MPLKMKPAVSALARQTIKTAYDDLDSTINLGDKRDFQNPTLQHVQKAALEIENQLAARQSLRNMRRLMPLFRGLEHYSKVVDILCNGTPYLPWIWAPITLILRIASEYVEAFEQIIKGYSSIAESLKRFEILSDAFINQPEFQQTLAVFYADILKFHKYAYKFVRRSGWKLMFSTSWGRFERRFANILEDLKQHGSLIDLEANARDIAEAKEMRNDIRKWREESENKVHLQETEENAKQYESIVSWLKVNESDQLAIFDSISSEAAEYQGTCGWILQNAKIRSWADSKPDTPALWLKGSAGSGKSVLCTQLVNFLKQSKFVVHHFCTYLYASSTMYEQIVRSLVLQILRKDGDLVAHVYKSCILEKKIPTVSVLEQLLQTFLASMSSEPNQAEYIWVVIDGLDECEPDKQIRLIRLINQITSKPALPGTVTCKVLISSRAPSNSLQRLRRKQSISLSEEKGLLQEAIRQYVDQRLKSMDTKLRQLDIDSSEIGEIRAVVVTKADGMFLYARLVMDYLASNIFYNGDEIKKSVNQLPQKLTDFYHKILTQILVQLDPRSVDRIRCVLGWIAFAKRPLHKAELLSAITFSSGDPEVPRLVPQYILDICGTLIEEKRDATFAFIHNSVKEFLQMDSNTIVVREHQAFREHGIASVTCLLSGLKIFRQTYPEHDRFIRVAKGLHGFHVYATEFWTEYLLTSAASGDVVITDPSLSLIGLACKLADVLEKLDPVYSADTSSSKPADERLVSLRQYGVLWKHVDRALRVRSFKNLEYRVLRDQSFEMGQQRPNSPLISDEISTMLAFYQETVESLLSQTYYPGLTTDELEQFKASFRFAAFTCRLASCSRATIGFETSKLLKAHEKSHLQWYLCTVAGCQYPPFVSDGALKRHVKNHHTSSVAPKAIRRGVTNKPAEAHSNKSAKPDGLADRSAPRSQAQRSSQPQPQPRPLVTSQPPKMPNGASNTKREAKPASGPFDPHDNDAANGLFMLAQAMNGAQNANQYDVTLGAGQSSQMYLPINTGGVLTDYDWDVSVHEGDKTNDPAETPAGQPLQKDLSLTEEEPFKDFDFDAFIAEQRASEFYFDETFPITDEILAHYNHTNSAPDGKSAADFTASEEALKEVKRKMLSPGRDPTKPPLKVQQDDDGVQWISFCYTRDKIEMEYTIRCDVESVNIDELSTEFKKENSVYPGAYCPKDQYRGKRLMYETDCNRVGWALAELNISLRGKRGLTQRAVNNWRNSNRDTAGI